MCNAMFPDPFVTLTWISDHRLFVNCFHNHDLVHYHFIYDLRKREIVGNISHRVLQCTKKNFPYRCFYNPDKDEVYSFYRQGQAFIIPVSDPTNYLSLIHI